MAHRNPASVLVVFLAVLSCGCGSTAEKHTANKPVAEPAIEPAAELPEPPATAAEGGDGAERRSIHDALAARLEKLEMEIAGLREKVMAFPEAVRKEWDETTVALDAEAHAARERLGQVGRATHEAWDHLRDDASAAWDRLESAVKKALADAQKVPPEATQRDEPLERGAGKD